MKTLNLLAASFLVGLFLVGCASTPGQQSTKPYYSYRAEMILTIGGRSFEGLVPVKVNGPIDIQIYSPITLNRVEISTCSRHEVIRNTANGWFDKVKNTMTYRYNPTPIELSGHCPLLFQAFNDHVQKAWGLVTARSDQNLPAKMECNGGVMSFAGISVCQTKSGLVERLTFAKPVEFEASPSCAIQTTDKMTFDVRSTQVGFCKATFTDGTDFHDLVLLGYDEATVY